MDLLGDAADVFDKLGYRIDADTGAAAPRAGTASGRSAQPPADVLPRPRRRFAAMGATPWVTQAEAELERVAPGRGQHELTPTEARIAKLVVSGRRNREIAAELFVSVATVEAHLTRMYRKLHVRSRSELARVVQSDV